MTRPTDAELLAMPTIEERLRALMLWTIRNQFDDPDPRSIGAAVFQIHKRSGLSFRQFALQLQSKHSTIHAIEGGHSRGTPDLLRRLAGYARYLRMPHTAEYLERQANALKYESYKKGGKR